MPWLLLLASLVITPPTAYPEAIHPDKIPDYQPPPPPPPRSAEWDTDDFGERQAATRRLVAEFDLPAEMVAIAACESVHDPEAINKTKNRDGSWDWGLWQINDRWWEEPLQHEGIIARIEDLLDPVTNARAAKIIAETERGLRHWVCYR